MDPLGGSSLSILEDGGGLGLVLDRLDEDDALVVLRLGAALVRQDHVQLAPMVQPRGDLRYT